MARKPKGRKIDGWLVIDKPSGMTSATAVARLKRLLDAAKAGHAGTLDPIATGVLPVALGEATKTVAFAMDGSKSYRFTVRWGEQRTTDDCEGEVVASSDHRPTDAEIRDVLPRFVGEIEQVPPAYSAVKVGGQRAYALARAGDAPFLGPRWVRVDRITLTDRPDRDHATFEVSCGKGAYMRGLVRDLAAELGTYGHITALRRLSVGRFSEAAAISLDKLEALGHSAAALEHLLPIETALADIPALALTEIEAKLLRSGRPVQVLRTADKVQVDGMADGETVCAMADGKPVALTRLSHGPVLQLHPVRVLNL
ncbi:MAG TPA: tRNA pseudouridine(55) synthase TruB [Alphaproteobacteria bacterium]|nr:tRNA pseudouridine(55) synthase TruB [Alphaproteobacteria bacterium]